MELSHEDGFLEEELLQHARSDDTNSSWPSNYFPPGFHQDDLFSSNYDHKGWNFDDGSFQAPNYHIPPFGTAQQQHLSAFSDQANTFFDASDDPLFPNLQEQDYHYPSFLDYQDEGVSFLVSGGGGGNNHCYGGQMEQISGISNNNNISDAGHDFCGDEKKSSNKGKSRLEGQPSKNLMAERRRRKRLNDRLSMLRSIVPKISKMDRTSVLGDTIDYMKELLERINKLQEDQGGDQDHQVLQPNHDLSFNIANSTSKEAKPNKAIPKNSPKFNVERGEMDIKVNVSCAPRPGLLVSTVSTLEALDIEIQQCVISCFSDFSMQASCSEGAVEQRKLISPEDIKQALFRTAGYGGKCL